MLVWACSPLPATILYNMYKKHLLWAAVLAMVLASCNTTKQITYFQDIQPGVEEQIQVGEDIRLAPDDKIGILVSSKNQELALTFNLPTVTYRMGQQGSGITNTNGQVSPYTVDANGDIDFPVLGKLHVAGMTRSELEGYIKGQLVGRGLIKDAVVTVDLLNLYVSVLGEVNKPGRYAIDRDRMTLLDVLGMAGDLTIFGQREHVYVLRTEGDKQTSYEVNLCSAQQLQESPVYYVQQGDVVYVRPNPMRTRQSTVNGNNVRSASFWLSVVSLVTSVTSSLVVLLAAK